MEKQKVLEFNLPADLGYSPIVRQLSQTIFEMHRFNSIWCHRLTLVVDELFMNAVKYGSAQEDTVCLKFIDEEERVAFSIEDHGTGCKKISPKELKEKIITNVDNNDVTRTSGRGLSLIAHYWTDEMEVTESPTGGIKVTFSKKKEVKNITAPAPIKIENGPTITLGVKIKPNETMSSDNKAKSENSVYTIELQGGIDQYNLEEKKNAMETTIQKIPAHTELVIDFKNIPYINSLFIGHLVAWYNQLREREVGMKIVHAHPEVRDILELVGLSKILTIN